MSAEAPGHPRPSRRTALDALLALAVAIVVVVPLTHDVAGSGAWDGDPSIHNRLAMETVNVVATARREGGEPLRGVLQSYYAFPKMAHELMLAGTLLVAYGGRPVTFAEVERGAAWFATIWTLVGVVALYGVLRVYHPRRLALVGLPLLALSGYVVLYASFPRHNMPAHALTWIATWLYLRWRTTGTALTPARAIALGLLFGVAVPVHYSATYWIGLVVACELVLALVDRRPVAALVSMAALGGAAAAVWVGLDVAYFALRLRYPDETNWLGEPLGARSYSFLHGMSYVQHRISTRAMADKIPGSVWWFLPGLLYRCVGPVGSALLAVGAVLLPVMLWRRRGAAATPAGRARIVLAVACVGSVALSLGYFQSARKLMLFLPFWGALLVLGMAAVARLVAVRLAPRDGAEAAPAWPALALRPAAGPATGLVLAALLLAQAITYGPAAQRIHVCRRDVGRMRAHLEAAGIDRILVLPQYQAASMAPHQRDLARLAIDEADAFDYVVLHRLYPAAHGPDTRGLGIDLMARLRPIEPIVSFDNQCALELFWYEFPLDPATLDPDDPLTHHRSLYRWADVREALRPLVDDRRLRRRREAVE